MLDFRRNIRELFLAKVLKMTRLLAFLLVCLFPLHAWGAWVDAAYADNLYYSPQVDDTIFNRLRSRAAYQCLTQFFNSDAFRYVNGVIQSDTDKTLTLRIFDSNGGYQDFTCNIIQPRICCLMALQAGSLDTLANLQVFAIVHLHVEYLDTNQNSLVRRRLPIYACYETDISWNSLTNSIIDNLVFRSAGDNWAFPTFVSNSADGSITAGAYLFKNSPGILGPTPILALGQQQQNNSFQTPQCWQNAWALMFNQTYFAGDGVTFAFHLLDGNNILYGQYPLNGIAGYIAIDPRTSLTSYINNDYDKGGQIDFSEYLLNKDMKDPSDDNPNFEESLGSIIQVSPPSVEGPTDIFDNPLEEPSEGSVEDSIEEVESRLTSVIEQNQGYQLLRSLIDPNGFATSVELPSWHKDISVSLFGSTWNIGGIDIDMNVLRRSPYLEIWTKLRAMMVLYLFISTWLVCYRIYEKSLSFSA